MLTKIFSKGVSFMAEISKGILLPFLGTSLGSACVFLMKNQFNMKLKRLLMGFDPGIGNPGVIDFFRQQQAFSLE